MATSLVGATLRQLLPATLPASLVAVGSRLLRFDELVNTYETLRHAGSDLPDHLLRHLRITCRVCPTDLDNLPKSGPAVVVANHPTGILDGAVLAKILAQRRSDVRLLASEMLNAVPELKPLLIPANPQGLRQCLSWLLGGGLLVVFPAGVVSHFQWRHWRVADPKWSPVVTRLVTLAGRKGVQVPVVPAFISAENSLLFQVAGTLNPNIRTALLPRELLNKDNTTVEVRFGVKIPATRLLAGPTTEEQTQYLRWRTYVLAGRPAFEAHTNRGLLSRRPQGPPVDISPATDGKLLGQDVRALPPASLLGRQGDLEVYLSEAARLPHVLPEIGRLREIAFRAVGEGSGRALDLDPFDNHYLHLFLWNPIRCEIVGAYRLVGTDMVADRAGNAGLYTATLFHFSDRFLRRLGMALELGRSFVRIEYQKSFAPLLLLWKGIGQFLAQNPRYRILFGPVSISNRYQRLSRELIVSFLRRSASLEGALDLVRPRQGPEEDCSPLPSLDLDDLSDAVADIEPDGTGIPVLLRQYLKLGGKLLGFNIDSEFADALDGLIMVDLLKTEPRLLWRHLGKQQAERLLAYQKGLHGTFKVVQHP